GSAQQSGSSASTRPSPSSSTQLPQSDSPAGPVETVSMLVSGLGSSAPPPTLAVLTKASADVRVATMVTVALAPTPSVPRSQASWPAIGPHVPWLGVTETTLTCAGTMSVTTTPGAVSGPAFVTVSVQVIWSPTATTSGAAVFTIERSAPGAGGTSSVAVPTSLFGFGSG